MKDLGEAKYTLGIKIHRDRSKGALSTLPTKGKSGGLWSTKRYEIKENVDKKRTEFAHEMMKKHSKLLQKGK